MPTVADRQGVPYEKASFHRFVAVHIHGQTGFGTNAQMRPDTQGLAAQHQSREDIARTD